MNLEEMIDKYVNAGYEQIDAEAKVSQDIIGRIKPFTNKIMMEKELILQ